MGSHKPTQNDKTQRYTARLKVEECLRTSRFLYFVRNLHVTYLFMRNSLIQNNKIDIKMTTDNFLIVFLRTGNFNGSGIPNTHTQIAFEHFYMIHYMYTI